MESYSSIFDDGLKNCDILIASLKDNHGCESTDTKSLDNFWVGITSTSKVLSHEVTKMAIAFDGASIPPESSARVLMGHLCNAASQLVGIYISLPNDVGNTFLQVVGEEFKTLLIQLRQFLESLHNKVCNSAKMELCLQEIGKLWNFCDNIILLPKNNSEATVSIISKEEQLISDALAELEESEQAFDSNREDGDSDEEPYITNDNVKFLPHIKGMIKTTLAVFRKSKKKLNSSSIEPTRLDPLNGHISGLSSIVDDLVCLLYSPLNLSEIVEQGSLLASKLTSILAVMKSVANEEDQEWIEFLMKATQHNLNKLHTEASR